MYYTRQGILSGAKAVVLQTVAVAEGFVALAAARAAWANPKNINDFARGH